MRLKTFQQKIGKEIAAKRKAKGISQILIEEKTGIDRANLAKHEKGRYNVTLKTLFEFAKALDCEWEFRLVDTSKTTRQNHSGQKTISQKKDTKE